MSTKTRGRKKMQASKKLGNLYTFTVRLNKRDAARLNSMVEQEGVKTSSYLREVFLNHLNNTSSSTSTNSSSSSNVDIDQVLNIVKVLYSANINVK